MDLMVIDKHFSICQVTAWAGKNLPKATGFARAGVAGYNGQYNDTIGVKKRPRDCLLHSQ